jgi:vancomycin resistance protein VanJ
MKLLARIIVFGLVASSWVYLTVLFTWLGLYLLFGTSRNGLFRFTSVVHLVFIPVLALLALAALTRRRSLWVGGGAAVLVWLALFGGLYNFPARTARAAGPTIRAMTYNVQFRNADVAAVAGTIRAADADVVGLQEVNPALAEDLEVMLAEEYPYQLHDPNVGVTGLSLLSRYPFEVVAARDVFQGFWYGHPQLVEVEHPTGSVFVINAHFAHGHLEDNAGQVVQFVSGQQQPVVVLGDMNTTDLADPYKQLVKGGLRDAWRGAGWGYGSTFPAMSSVGRIRRVPVLVPSRLVRIDYVFHSAHFTPRVAERLPWDGRSDHLAVVAELSLSAE